MISNKLDGLDTKLPSPGAGHFTCRFFGTAAAATRTLASCVCDCKRDDCPFCYFPAVDEQALFRRRLRQLVLEKYGSLDRFYLETDFSKGHLSQILRSKRSPSLATMTKLAKALNVRVAEFFRPV